MYRRQEVEQHNSSLQVCIHSNAVRMRTHTHMHSFAIFISLHLPLTSRLPSHSFLCRYNISWTVDSYTYIDEYKLSYRRLPQGREVDNSIDTHTGSSSSSTLLQMYGSVGGGSMGSQHNHRLGSGLGAGLSSYGNMIHYAHNDWHDVVLAAMPVSHHYTQGMSYMIRGLHPDQHYEATVQAR